MTTLVDTCQQPDAGADREASPAPSALKPPQTPPTPGQALTTDTTDTDARRLALGRALRRVASGESVTDATAAEGLTFDTLYDAAQADGSIASGLARAREVQAHVLAERYRRELDSITGDNHRAKDVLLKHLGWLMGKLNRAVYGDAPSSVVAVQATGPLTVVMRDEGRSASGASVERARGPADPADQGSG